jgi:carboxymethylenebutenolidase
MCFDADAHPPELPFPLAGGAGDGRSVTLTGADGNRFPAYAAVPLDEGGAASSGGSGTPAVPPRTGIVVMPDIRGLVPYYEELALRFAEAGVRALAIDLYARTAGSADRVSDFDYREHAGRTTQQGIAADVGAAISYLRSDEMGADGALFCVGFCFAGRASLLQGIEPHGLAGVISFYGLPTGAARNGSPAPADLAGRYRSAVLALYGGADEGIPSEAIETFDRELEAAGVDHESVVYPGAPHSFFDRHQAEYGEASADAWRRVLDFMSRHAASGTQAPA